MLSPSQVYGLSVSQAQVCADKLLEAYNNKTYPRKLLAVDAIVGTAFGGIFKSFTPTENKLALEVGEIHIQESFTEPSGNYKYWDLVVATSEKTGKENEYRVEGMVSVTSPKAKGRYTFLALVLTPGCKVRQVRIADIMTLVDKLKASLASDSRVRKLFSK